MAISFTLFKSIFDNKTEKRMDFSGWEQFEALLYSLSKVERKSKQDAQLISPAVYEPNTTRANKNVTAWAGWAAVDVDDHEFKGNLKDELRLKYGHWKYICYSTASSTNDSPKFRLVFLLEGQVEVGKIKQFWYALNAELGSIGDKQTKDLSRMYYIPANYAGANNFIFSNNDGAAAAINPASLIEKHPSAPAQREGASFMDRLPEAIQSKVIEHRKNALEDSGKSIHWSSYRDCPFMSRKLIDEYKSISSGGWYYTMYRIMVSVAANAVRKGYPISSHEIASLCRELDVETGNWYEGRPLDVEADRAIEFVYKNM